MKPEEGVKKMRKYRGVHGFWTGYTIAPTRGRAASNLNHRYRMDTGMFPDPLFIPEDLELITEDLDVPFLNTKNGQMTMKFFGKDNLFLGFEENGVVKVKEAI